MFTLTYDSLCFDDNQLPDFVASVSNHVYGKRISLKESIASGDYKSLEFSNGFRAFVSNYILNEDFTLELAVAKEDYLALHINQIQAGSVFNIILNGNTVSYDDKIITSIVLTSSKDSFVLSGSKGACVNRLKILVPRIWLVKNLAGYNEDLLQTYLELQEDRLFADAMDNTYRSMVDKVMSTEDSAFYLSITENIVGVITERFFNRLNVRMKKNQKGNEIGGSST